MCQKTAHGIAIGPKYTLFSPNDARSETSVEIMQFGEFFSGGGVDAGIKV